MHGRAVHDAGRLQSQNEGAQDRDGPLISRHWRPAITQQNSQAQPTPLGRVWRLKSSEMPPRGEVRGINDR
jgi:hypothetical protein